VSDQKFRKIFFDSGSTPYNYDCIAPIRKARDEYNIEGVGLEWSHKTMDSTAACQIIDKVVLSIEKSIEDESIANITTIRGKPDDPLFPKGKLDMAIMVNVFHQVDKPVTFFQNMKPCLKPGATLVIVQWDSTKMKIEHPDMSAKDTELFSKEYVLQRVKAAGYQVLRLETFLPVQNIYICRSTK
jgi:SAM-dependent methyltransferase